MPNKELISDEWKKVCSRANCHMAGIPQPVSNFYNQTSSNDGLNSGCKKCRKTEVKNYYNHNKEKIAVQERLYQQANKEAIAERKKKHYHKNRDKILKQKKEYYCKNKEKVIENVTKYEKKRRAIDPKYRFRKNVSSSIRVALKAKGKTKGGSTFDHLPYTPKELMEHIEKQFDEHMTWENHGSYWHLDHIKPHASYKYDSLTDPEFQECWALENLRPLKASENMSKGSFWEGKRHYHNEAA